MNEKKYDICLITFPILASGITPLSQFIEILGPLSNNLFIVTGNEATKINTKWKKYSIYFIKHDSGNNFLSRVIKYLLTEISICFKLISLHSKIDIILLTLGAEFSLISMIVAKVFRKKVIIIPAANSSKMLKLSNDPMSIIVKLMERINYFLSNNIMIYSKNMIKELNIECHKSKIIIARRHYIDNNKYKIKTKIGRAHV